jgi:hypothetical protein
VKVWLAFGAAAATIALVAPTVAVARSPIASNRTCPPWATRCGPAEEEFLWPTASVEPSAYLFGQRVTAHLDIVYDTDRVVPESLKVEPDFAPYRILKSTSARQTIGHSVRLHYVYVLDCLTERCLPPAGGYLNFRPVEVAYQRRDAPNPGSTQVEWPDVRVASRIGTSGGFGGLRFSADVRQLPPPSYRVDPGLLTAVGYSLAALFAAIGLLVLARTLDLPALVAAELARRRARFSALHRALALVRSARDYRERRRALDRLAAELRYAEPELAVRATGLAWRKTAPSDPAVEPFSDEVEDLIERGAR